MRRSVAAVALLLATVFRPASAGAQRLAILDLTTEGLPLDVRRQFETAVEEQLRRSGHLVLAHSIVLDALAKNELPDGCTFGPCVAAIARALEVDRLLDVRITAEGPSYGFVVSLVGPGGAPIAQSVGNCGVCTVVEALDRLATTIAALDVSAARFIAEPPPRAESPPHRSKVWPILLAVGGAALAGGGVGLVAATEHQETGWVTIGSGGTLFLTGLVLLLVGD